MERVFSGESYQPKNKNLKVHPNKQPGRSFTPTTPFYNIPESEHAHIDHYAPMLAPHFSLNRNVFKIGIDKNLASS